MVEILLPFRFSVYIEEMNPLQRRLNEIMKIVLRGIKYVAVLRLWWLRYIIFTIADCLQYTKLLIQNSKAYCQSQWVTGLIQQLEVFGT